MNYPRADTVKVFDVVDGNADAHAHQASFRIIDMHWFNALMPVLPVPSVYWIDELYTKEDFGRFFLIRTTESPTKDGST